MSLGISPISGHSSKNAKNASPMAHPTLITWRVKELERSSWLIPWSSAWGCSLRGQKINSKPSPIFANEKQAEAKRQTPLSPRAGKDSPLKHRIFDPARSGSGGPSQPRNPGQQQEPKATLGTPLAMHAYSQSSPDLGPRRFAGCSLGMFLSCSVIPRLTCQQDKLHSAYAGCLLKVVFLLSHFLSPLLTYHA